MDIHRFSKRLATNSRAMLNMRILVHGQASWCKSAYGHQIRLLMDTLVAQGHTVAQSVTYGFAGRKIVLGDITYYPEGDKLLEPVIEDFKADWVISLGDVFQFVPNAWAKFPHWVTWATVDSSPLWGGIRNILNIAKHPLAYSQYGQRVMQGEGYDAHYIPLAFDPEAFYPMPIQHARAEAQLPQDRFIVGIVQANRGTDNRKNWFDQLMAFREFQKKHSDAFLYLHTCMSGYRGGFDLTAFCTELGMVLGRDYAATNEYVETTLGATDEQMRALYNSFDVLLQATKAEGFGVPALEASACRKPVVYTDFAALPEAVHFGYKVEHELEWQPAGSWYARPTRDSIVDALERAYAVQEYDLNKGEPTAYRSDLIAENYWLPYMTQLAQELEAQPA